MSVLSFMFANVVDKLIPFAFLPIFTQLLSPEEFGLTSLFFTVVPLSNLLILMAMDGAVGVYFFKPSDSPWQKILSSALLVAVFNTAILFLIATLFRADLEKVVGLSIDWVLLAFVGSLGFSFIMLTQSYFRSTKNVGVYASIQCGRTMLETATALVLLIAFSLSWKGRVLGWVGANILLGLGCLIYWQAQSIGWKVEPTALNKATRFGLSLIPHSIATWAIAYSDRYFINQYGGLHETGVYSLAFTLGMAISALIQGLNQAWVPLVYERLSSGKRADRLRLVQTTYFGFVGLLLSALLISAALKVGIDLFFPPQYAEAKRYLDWISLSYAFDGMYTMVCTYVFYSTQNIWLSLVSTLVALTKLCLNFWLISSKGSMGAAYATLIAFALQFSLTWIVASRIFPMPWYLGFRLWLKYRFRFYYSLERNCA